MIDPESSSFRDPDAKVISVGNKIYRLVYQSYKQHYDKLINSGLKELLIKNGYLISEQLVSELDLFNKNLSTQSVYKVLEPEIVPFISYPYEWSFSQLKEAALLTLSIQEQSLEKGLSLKDASAFNVQFHNGKAVFIDSTSFEEYIDDLPWVAYGQFCRHFLGPLLLFKYNLNELVALQKTFLDGIPLKIISKSLPVSTRFNFAILSHVHYHSKLEAKYSQNQSFKHKQIKLTKSRLKALIIHLKETIKSISPPKSSTEWTDYYKLCSYEKESFEHKKELVSEYLGTNERATLLDLGCNEGEFTQIACLVSKHVISVDADNMVIERLFKKIRKDKVTNVLPLVIDICNPSPGIGWVNNERTDFLKRTKFDTVLALAVIHHLAIGNNVPMSKIAQMFAQLTNELIIEFVPKDDVQTQRLLVTKRDVFNDYSIGQFKTEFSKYFTVVREEPIKGTSRKLFLMKKHD